MKYFIWGFLMKSYSAMFRTVNNLMRIEWKNFKIALSRLSVPSCNVDSAKNPMLRLISSLESLAVSYKSKDRDCRCQSLIVFEPDWQLAVKLLPLNFPFEIYFCISSKTDPSPRKGRTWMSQLSTLYLWNPFNLRMQ